MQSRYYDPETGRFLNADSQLNTDSILGNNLFSYCNNNPIMLTDSNGHIPFFAITAAVGALVGAVVGGVKAAKSGKSIWKGALKGAAIGGLIGLGAGAAAGALLAGSVVANTGAVIAGGAGLISTISSGGLGAGVIYVANNLQQAGNEISSTVSTATQKIVSKTPTNPGKPFEIGKTGFQYGVNPNTLTPQKDLATLNPQRMADAVKYAGDKSIIVGQNGMIQDGHHRVANAIMNGRAIDIFVERYK